jgi:hypothetical protein
MNRMRGGLMLAAACAAFWRGWRLHTGHMALLAYGLGLLALALAAWHIAHKPPPPRGG